MNLVIITSVINTINKPLSYTPTRSVFSVDERFNQTIKSIESVRKNIKKSFIVLVEGSQIDEKYETILKKNVNHYYNVSNNIEIKNNIDSPSKLRGEISLIFSYLCCEFFDKSLFKTISKLSGRYYLTDDFIDLEEYMKYNDIFCHCTDNKTLCTVFYTINNNEFNDYYNSLDHIYNNLDSYENQSIENILYLVWLKNKNYNSVNRLGVGGNVAVNNEFVLI